MSLLFREHPKAQPEGGFDRGLVVFVGLLFREHPKAQPGGGFWRSPGSNLRPLVYLFIYLFIFFFLGKTSTIGGCFCGFCCSGST